MWGDRQKVEEKVEEKKTPEQSKQEADDLITRMSAAFENTIKPLREKVESYENRFATIEEATKRPAKTAEKQEFTDIYENPDQAIAERLLPINVAVVQLNARMTEDEVYREMSDRGWGAYVSKVKEALQNVNIQAKASPEYASIVRNTVDMVVGKEAREKGLRFDNGKQSFFMEDANSRTSGDNTPSQMDAKLVEMATDGRIEMLKSENVTANDVRTFLQKKFGITDVDKFIKTVVA